MYVLGLKVFLWFNCDVWRDVVWSVLRVLLESVCFFSSGVLRLRVRVCLMRLCVVGVIYCVMLQGLNLFLCVVCVFECLLLCVVYV